MTQMCCLQDKRVTHQEVSSPPRITEQYLSTHEALGHVVWDVHQ